MILDDYTPHGYLDVPSHTRRLTPRGVVRSHDVGFRWHFPALARSYGGRRETYRAGLRIGLDGALALDDFDHVVAPYHSSRLVRFAARRGPAELEAEFFLVGDHVLCARVTATPTRHLSVRADYTRLLAADHGWGESGLVGRSSGDVVILQGFEDGEAFALKVRGVPAELRVTGAAEVADTWTRSGVDADNGTHAETGAGAVPVTVLGRAGEQVTVSGVATVDGPGRVECLVLLARGRTADEALERLASAGRRATTARTALLAEDERFWSRAPRLDGDWPDHWRRGVVYDLETVRMMVKPPVGIYRRPWDAMQIQAPRVVLGEAAIDALLLAYADPQTAQELIYGTFADAPAPNVPCSREDGTYNMVSADGTVCGTGPQWGYPWVVLAHLYALRPDRTWLDRLYPHLAAYLDWWLAHRRDADGWLVHACSWESGQDLSPRFGDQPLGGGHPTWTTRPVDLQAAFAHAAEVMAGFAVELGRDHDADRWRRLAAEFRERTERMWNAGRYADIDATTSRFRDVDDVMLFAPVALGVAAPERAKMTRAAIRAVDPDTVVWPMFAWTVVDAATAVGDHETAARVAASIVDRAYTFWDARDYDQSRTLPGVACEYWPLSGRCGGEGYGWGAFTTHLLLGVLVGLRPEADGLVIRPNLPASLREPGRRYGVRMTVREVPLVVTLMPLEDGVEVDVAGRRSVVAWGSRVHLSWAELGLDEDVDASAG